MCGHDNEMVWPPISPSQAGQKPKFPGFARPRLAKTEFFWFTRLQMNSAPPPLPAPLPVPLPLPLRLVQATVPYTYRVPGVEAWRTMSAG